MSDLANFVLAGVRDKVVQELKDENSQLSRKNAALSKALLLQAPSFGRIEVEGNTVLARTKQFPDPQKCSCCSWFSLKMTDEATLKLDQFESVAILLGATQEAPLAKSNEIKMQQVTGYCRQSNRAAMQFLDASIGVTLHVSIGPIPREVASTFFARTPRKIKEFCQGLAAVAPGVTVSLICLSILNEVAIPMLTTKGSLTDEEARNYLGLRLPDAHVEEANESLEEDEAKDS